MKFEQLYSSSSGNAYVVTANNGKRLLIECGVVWPTLTKALHYDLKNISGCLLTHEHKDHSKAIRDVMKAGIDVYASGGTFEAMGLLGERRGKVISSAALAEAPRIGPFIVRAYTSNHDAAEPLLFTVLCDNEFLLFATDTPFIKQRFKTPFNIIAIECSYNEPYLRKRVEEKTINVELAKRLLDSHMSEANCLAYLRDYCDLTKCTEIHLLHLSADNINKKRICEEFKRELFVEIKVI